MHQLNRMQFDSLWGGVQTPLLFSAKETRNRFSVRYARSGNSSFQSSASSSPVALAYLRMQKEEKYNGFLRDKEAW